MKKLKPWQIVLLIIFYPAGIVYLIIWFIKRSRNQSSVNGKIPTFSGKDLATSQQFHSKVVGVTFNNDDGSSRQDIIRSCHIGDDLIFRPMPTDKYPEAIGVFTESGKQLGHLNAKLAHDMHTIYKNNPMSVKIASLTGGENSSFGCNILITIYDAPTAF